MKMGPAITCKWATPQRIFDALNEEFNFDLDACADPTNFKCARYYSFGGLTAAWEGSVWCNPPYGSTITQWISKGYFSATVQGVTVVMLVPSRTDTKWWHDYCMKGEIRFLKGRLNFTGDSGRGRAPFPSAVVIFRPL